ncbi:Cobalt-zinc-cadmium resistance protein CzcA [Myxococcus hansupus]|uniref:Cobalt-zinc-cadmium resistance protein CzcA n=1 Tax=Pseudomyxococcus hansupus TaxID=1297742 RepID=A0A0H4X5Q4_9BACT|nr:efflux RND transporter permease subunit [Myxococcus hansupus]AKQ69213.1 Cobalt-zinc-cadmium resistance protein CzcA [Myxococcus hansupus]
MRNLIAACLNFRLVPIAASVLLLILGYTSLRQMPVDVFPEFAPPLVEIQTEVPGLSSLEVEQLVTTPLENALAGVPALQTLRSKSVLGLSSVVLIFERGSDLFRARQLVQERLARIAPTLPVAARPPVMLSPVSATSRVLKVGLRSDTLDRMALSDMARWTIRPRLMGIPGVANVAIWGQRDRQYQVKVDPERLRAANVSLDDVLRVARDASVPTTGGFVDTPNQRLAVSLLSAASLEALKEVPVAFRNGASIRLADVATVEEGHPPPIGEGIVDDTAGILLIVEKQPWGNTLEVTEQVESMLEQLRPALEGVTIVPGIFRPATFIETALGNLQHAVVLGCVMVIVVLFAFLQNWRTAAISIVAIPLSLVGAIVALRMVGATIDTMVLAGLVLALGEVVDDAIIDVENVQRRLEENRALGSPRSMFQVVLDASMEVRSAVVYATVIVILVFLPVFFLEGVSGAFFRPLAVAYVLSVGASMVVALTLTPVLCMLFLTRKETHAPRLGGWMRDRVGPWVAWVLDRPKMALRSVVAVLVAGFALAALLGEGFLPHFQESDFLMHWVAKPGTSGDAVLRTALRASEELRAIPGVKHFGAHIGRAEVADEVVGPNFAELWISLDGVDDYAATVRHINEVVEGYPGLYRDVQTYLQERIKEVLSGASGSIVVRAYGPDLDALRSKAGELEAKLRTIPGVVNLKVEPQVLVPQLQVRLSPEAGRRLGLTPGDVQRAVATLLQGTKVGEVYIDERTIDVVVWGDDALRQDVAAVKDLRLMSASGAPVRLGDVASVEMASVPNIVQHEGASRRLDITCDPSGRALGAVVSDIQAVVSGMDWPAGHYAEVLGEYAERQAARTRLFVLSLLAVLGIAMVLYLDFQSPRLVAFTLGTLPFALVGGLVGVLMTGGVVSLGSLVGFVTVLGVAARNGILLVSHYRHLEEVEGVPFGRELVLQGTLERLQPMAMTTLTTALALLPLVAGGLKPGQEIEHPMAVVILGGLFSSAVLNVLLVPSLYLRFGRGSRPRDVDAARPEAPEVTAQGTTYSTGR